MRQKKWSILCLLLLAAPILRADATIRYQLEFKLGPLIPPSTIAKASGGVTSIPPITTTLQIKGDKELSSAAKQSVIIDLKTQQVTMIDPADKQYATFLFSDLFNQMTAQMPATAKPANIPPQVRMLMQSMKADLTSEKTGRKDVILGIPVEESIWTVSLEMPANALPIPGFQGNGANPNIVLVKMVAHVWSAGPDVVKGNAALSEVMSKRNASVSMYSPDSFLKTLGDYPALQSSISAMFARFTASQKMTMKMDAQLYFPVLVQAMPLLQSMGQKLPPDFDPTASLGTMHIEMTDISAAPIDASLFQVPKGYTAIPMQDLMKNVKAPVPAATAATPKAPASKAPIVWTNQ
jgi:hypothetical protein